MRHPLRKRLERPFRRRIGIDRLLEAPLAFCVVRGIPDGAEVCEPRIMTSRMMPRPETSTQKVVGPAPPWHAAIVVPARNEEGRIVRALEALAVAIDEARPLVTGVVVVVVNTTDRSFAKVAAWADAHPGLDDAVRPAASHRAAG